MAILMYCILFAFIQTGSHAHEFRVGGKSGWAVPNNTNTESYSDWAGRNRFQVGDSLVFLYNSSEDSVLQVTHGDYISCSTSQPIASFKNGNTVFKFPQPGSYFFISGASGHCQKSQKLHVIVLSIRGGTPSLSPARSPPVASPVPAPAPAALNTMATPAPSPSPSMAIPAAPPTSTSVPAAPALQSAGFMCGLLLSLCVLIL
jgi:hypothetical protein